MSETYYERNKDKVRLKQKEWLHTEAGRRSRRRTERRWCREHPERYLLKLAKARAKRAGVKCTISVEDVVIPTHCPILDIELKMGKWERHDGSPSLDRIDNTKGYVAGNIAVISWRANHMKKNLSEDVLTRLLQYVRGEL